MEACCPTLLQLHPFTSPCLSSSRSLCIGSSSPSCLRALSDHGKAPLSPEEKAKLSLKDLDDQLAQLSQRAPRPISEPSNQELNEPIEEKTTPQVSSGFLFYVGFGLLLLTVVNNLLYHFLLEIPERDSRLAQEMQDSQMFNDKDSRVYEQP